jgi:hypothetical protein
MLKPPGFNPERRGSAFLADPTFTDNSRRRGSIFNSNLNAHIASLGGRGSTMLPSMDPSGTGVVNRRSSILDGVPKINQKLVKRQHGQENLEGKNG